MDCKRQAFSVRSAHAIVGGPQRDIVAARGGQLGLQRVLLACILGCVLFLSLGARVANAADSVAVAYAPRVVEDTDDGFPPVSWFVVGSLGWAGDLTRLCIAGACGATIYGRALGPNQDFGEYLRYPAGANTINERASFANTISGTPSLGSPVVYYYRAPRSPDNSYVIRYWIFYSFNWFNANETCGSCGGLSHDLHEGDWEHIDIRFNSADKPLRVRLSEHQSYTPLNWDGAGLRKDGTHLITYVARGDHANYPHTGAWPLRVPEIGSAAFALLNGLNAARDYVGVNHSTRQFSPDSAHVGNLAGPSAVANYSCWGGRMGEQFLGGPFSGAWGTSPNSPLAQSRDLPGVNATCSGATSALTEAQATNIQATQYAAPDDVPDVDPLRSCAGWYGSPVAVGEARIVSCDQSELTRYFSAGVPDGTQLNVTMSSDSSDLAVDPGPPTVGIVSTSQLAQVAVVAQNSSVSTIAVEMADDGGTTTGVTFPDVSLVSGQRLRLAPGIAGTWNLLDAAGHVVSSALSQLIPTAGLP